MKNETEWPTSAETSAVAWPIDVMDGAEWNLLDATGTRIAMCGIDGADPTRLDGGQDCFGSGRDIGIAIVGMLRNLKCDNEQLRAIIKAAEGLEEEVENLCNRLRGMALLHPDRDLMLSTIEDIEVAVEVVLEAVERGR